MTNLLLVGSHNTHGYTGNVQIIFWAGRFLLKPATRKREAQLRLANLTMLVSSQD